MDGQFWNCYVKLSDERILMCGNIAGPLLDAVQMSSLYPDSKTFVDKKLKQSPGKIIKRFEDLVKSNDGKSLTKEQIKEVNAQTHQRIFSTLLLPFRNLFISFSCYPFSSSRPTLTMRDWSSNCGPQKIGVRSPHSFRSCATRSSEASQRGSTDSGKTSAAGSRTR